MPVLNHAIFKEIMEKALTAGQQRDLVTEVRQEYPVSERCAYHLVRTGVGIRNVIRIDSGPEFVSTA